jgi:hypothetical protein
LVDHGSLFDYYFGGLGLYSKGIFCPFFVKSICALSIFFEKCAPLGDNHIYALEINLWLLKNNITHDNLMFNFFFQIKTGCVMVQNSVLMDRTNLGVANLDYYPMIDFNAFLMVYVYL